MACVFCKIINKELPASIVYEDDICLGFLDIHPINEGANLMLSDGTVAGQEVMHSHLHIVPRFRGDGQRVGFSHSAQVARPRLDEVAHKIAQFLSK